VIGQETSTARLYNGAIRATDEDGPLRVKGLVDGQAMNGELILPHGKLGELAAKCRIGSQSFVGTLHVQGVGDNYPRIYGYLYPVSASGVVIPTISPRLETWFFDWKY
jgi:hypothetical protein